MRSGALAFLVGLLLLLIDVFLVQLPVFQSLGAQAALAAVPQFSLTTAIRTLQAVLGRDTGGLAFADLPVPGGPLNLDPVVLAGILVAWGAALPARRRSPNPANGHRRVGRHPAEAVRSRSGVR